jgi:hypothetical protein
MSNPDFVDFDIRIEFARGEGDPTRVFRSMADLIDAFQRIDTHLAPMLGATVRTSLVLQDIEAASLKSRLRTVIESVPDEALKQGEVKKLIGHFLLQGKHKVLDWCRDRNEVGDRQEVKLLEAKLTAARSRNRSQTTSCVCPYRYAISSVGHICGERRADPAGAERSRNL